MARGVYFWLCSDDDLPVTGAVAELLLLLKKEEYDLIYLTSYGYRNNWLLEQRGDPLDRHHHTVTNELKFASVVNIMFTFISGIISNKQRLLDCWRTDSLMEDPSAFIGTHLTQLSWTLPLLRHHRKSLIMWQRPLASRIGHGGGYDLAQTFGEDFVKVVNRCLPGRSDLTRAIINPTLRKWFPSIIVEIRSAKNSNFKLEEAHGTFTRVFGANFRYWLFTYPALKLPLLLAKKWLLVSKIISKFMIAVTYTGFWRKRT